MAKRLPAGVEADGESSGPGSVGAGSARVGLAGLLRDLTPRPGVYRMLDTSGVLLYVGKARNLRKRVSSYLRSPESLPVKTRAMMAQVESAPMVTRRCTTVPISRHSDK